MKARIRGPYNRAAMRKELRDEVLSIPKPKPLPAPPIEPQKDMMR
jgi:hypothetical protein